MNRFLCSLILIFVGITSSFAQSTISKTWSFESVTDSSRQYLSDVQPEEDYLKIENGNFEYLLSSHDSTAASGSYIYQNEVLVFFYDNPQASIANFKGYDITDATLELLLNTRTYNSKD